MRKFLSIMLAVMIVASVAVVSFSAEGTGVATVTLQNVKGETVTQTYAVGETFTAYTYLNASQVNSGKIGSLNGAQYYTNAVLELADEYDPDPEAGDITDLESMFPVTKDATVASGIWTETEEDPSKGAVYYNASVASLNGFKFDGDGKALIVTHYTVKAAGAAVIENKMLTLACSDNTLTRIIDRGSIVNENFTSPIALSEPTIPLPTGFTVSGAITSYLDAEGVVTVKLEGVNNDFTATVTGTIDYSITDVPAGTFKLSVAKKDHVTRVYDVAVTGDTTQDVKICPIGDCDLNGKVQAADAMKAYKHAQGKADEQLSGYAFDCADVAPIGNPNGKVQAADAMNIYQQAQGKHNLF